MKSIQTRFERDPSLNRIEIVIRAPEMGADVSRILEELSHGSDSLIVTDESGGWVSLPVAEIVSASVLGRQVRIVTENGLYLSRQSLQSIEDMLDSRRFVRISRYEIVNLSKVRRYDFTLSGTLRLELAGGMETWASRRCIPQIRKMLLGKE